MLRGVCGCKGWKLVATHRGKRPTLDGGREVRRLFHPLRSLVIEHFKGIFDAPAPVPTQG